MTLSEAHEYRIALRPTDAPEASILQSNIVEGAFRPHRIWLDQTCEFEALIANTYEVVIERRDQLPSGTSSITRWTPVSKPAKVRVIAGAQASLLLEHTD